MFRRPSTILLALAIGACSAAPAEVTTTQPVVTTTVAPTTTAVPTTTTTAPTAEELFLAGLTEWGGTDEAKLSVGKAICEAMTAGTPASTIFDTFVAVSAVDPDELIVIGQQAITTLCPAHRLNGGWDALEIEAQRPTTTTAPPSPTSPKGDGFYTVGDEIAAGIWRSNGSGDGCYWARLDSNQGILDNHYGIAGGSVTIRSSDYEVEFNGCGTWEFQG